MASDCDDNLVVAKQKGNGNGDAGKMTSSVSLSLVTGNGMTASTSSIAPLVGATVGVKTQSPRSPDRTRAAKTNESGLDFIGTSNAVKKLFSISLDALSAQDPSIRQTNNRNANKKPTLLAVHNFDGTLIIDDAEDEASYEYLQSNNNNNEDNNNHYYHSNSFNPNHYSKDEIVPDTQQSTATLLPPSSQSLALALSPATTSGNHIDLLSSDAISMISNIVQSTAVTTNADDNALSENEHTEGRKGSSNTSSTLLSPPKAPREYVQWKFQDLNMILGHDTLVVRPPKDSSTTATAPDGSAGGGIAVRVEDVRFLRSVWETFQREQSQKKHQRLLGSTNTPVRSYAQALLQEHEEDPRVPSGSKDLSNTTSTVVSAIDTITTNHPQQSVVDSDSSDDNQSKREFSEVPLQTCIVPFSGPLSGKIPPFDSSPSNLPSDQNRVSSDTIPSTTSISPGSNDSRALSIVLDAYLDNLMTNVPQLALCLEEKGLIQSIKMLPTEEIPSMMLHPSTLDTSRPLDALPSRGVSVGDAHPADGGRRAAQHVHRHSRRRSSSNKLEETIFSPQMMETNASALLRFLKTNCTRNNATYLLRHDGLNEAALDDGSGSPPQNIRLYDISSISAQKQKKWIWWLATMSYRFALRLRHLETSAEASFSGSEGILTESQKRAIRDRQRSLFQQTLDLLQDLMDIDGNAHESMVASVREHMADTYLSSVVSGSGNGELSETISSVVGADSRSSSPRKQSLSEMSPSPSPPVVIATISTRISADPSAPLSYLSSVKPINSPQLPNSENAPTIPFSDSNKSPERQHRHPYAAVPVDALNKAQDHLVRGIKALSTLFERDVEERRLHIETKKLQEEMASKRSRRRQRKQRRFRDDVDSTSEDQKREDDGRIPRLSPAMVLQLFGMNFKLVNTSLRLAEHHLGNYYSSSAMQALRTAARRLNDAANLLDYHNAASQETETEKGVQSEEDEKRTESLQLQYISLLEHCGHFARSFASDELWRDRGHASGEDVISVLSDVEAVFVESRKIVGGNDDDEKIEKSESRFWKMVRMDVLLKRSKGKVSLHSLSGIIAPFKMNAGQSEEAIDAAKAVLAKEKVLKRERRKVLVASCVLYSRAIMAFQFTVKISDQTEQVPDKMVLLNLLRQRLGDACNETGKVLLAALRTFLVNNQGSKKNDESQLAAEALLDSAEFWFTQGLEAFEACKDTRNLALLRCNLCQSFKLRANSGFSKRDSSPSSKHAENCLQQAADQLMTAHVDLGQRDTDPQTWDMVSEELAATFLVLGVRRRQSLLGSGNAPVIFQVMRLSPGEERSIVDPMERALKIYEQSDNAHQAAATHYQLALTFSKLWTCQLNETNTRKKLSKAFEHYSSAFNYFSTHSRGNEPTFCLLCLDLASLYAAIPGEEGLLKSLGCCLDCCDTFSMEAIKVSTTNPTVSTSKLKADWYDKMETIAKSVDDRVFKLLRSLVKVDPTRYKDMYREGLTAKMVRDVPDESEELDWNPKSSTLLALHEVLLAIKKMYGVIVSKS